VDLLPSRVSGSSPGYLAAPSTVANNKIRASHSCKQQNTKSLAVANNKIQWKIGDGRNSKFKTQHNIKDIKREMKNIHTEPPSKWRGKQ
jgi:hypothetical protein